MPQRAGRRGMGFGAVLKTIFWSFFGVRRKAGHEVEAARLKPAQLVLAAIVAAAVFVIALVLLARFIVGMAAA